MAVPWIMALQVAASMAAQRKKKEAEQRAAIQAGLEEAAGGAEATGKGQQAGFDELMNVYKTAFLGR